MAQFLIVLLTPAKPLLPLPMTGQMGTTIASMGEMLGEQVAIVPALTVTMGTGVTVVKVLSIKLMA